MSQIEWTDRTWNPFVGCKRISPGCDHCYAIQTCGRGLHDPHKGTTVLGDWTGVVNENGVKKLHEPLYVRRPTVWFVNSLSDMFYEGVSDEMIVSAFDVMNQSPQHQFQVLTKRPSRGVKKTAELGLNWTTNIWAGVSVEENKYAGPRVRELNKLPATIRFVSAEPLLGDLPDLDVGAVDWVIAGGESGPKARRFDQLPMWLRNIRDRCAGVGTAFFFKQWGTWAPNPRTGVMERGSKSFNGHLLDGEEIFQMPETVYDRMPTPDPRWTRVPLGRSGLRPTDRHAASGYKYAVETDDGLKPTDDAVEAVEAKLLDRKVLENPNYKAGPADIARIELAIREGIGAPADLARRLDIPEREVIRACKLMRADGRLAEAINPVRYFAVGAAA